MASALTLPTVILSGQVGVVWPSFAVGETVNIPLQCNDPTLGSALNLSTSTVTWTLANQVTNAVIISRAATMTAAALGQCTVAIVTSDTVTGVVPIPYGYYNVDCWAEDGAGNRLCLSTGYMFLAPAYRL